MIIVIDIGSTIIKVVLLDGDHSISDYRFHDRDYSVHVSTQVSRLLEEYAAQYPEARYRICSSANGGLRIGIVCLTERFSGRIARNLALAAGGNVVYLTTVDSPGADLDPVDALVVVGGVDCAEVDHMKSRIELFNSDDYLFRTLIYAGNSSLASDFIDRYPQAHVVGNPMGENLDVANEELHHKIRDLYLDDLVDKEGVSKLQSYSDTPIRPTPSVVNTAFEGMSKNGWKLRFPSPSIVVDIGGATTDVHFGVEVLAEGDAGRTGSYLDSNRHVFTDLGVFTSRDSTLSRLADHDRLYDFFRTMNDKDASRAYAEFREGVFDDDLPFYACFFLAFDSLASVDDTSSPSLNISKISSVIITGGASKRVDAQRLSELTRLFLGGKQAVGIPVHLDAGYSLWVEGMLRLPLLTAAE
ncbi:MAG: glutamate mutase L [Chloroflexi bacterium]|nr:glutamate mutase L [Chloroflexota bacterium]